MPTPIKGATIHPASQISIVSNTSPAVSIGASTVDIYPPANHLENACSTWDPTPTKELFDRPLEVEVGIMYEMNSMTGFGRGETLFKGYKISVEISSVNRRQLEIETDIPEIFGILEPKIKEAISSQIARGRVTVRIHMEPLQNTITLPVRININAAKDCLRQLKKLARELDLAPEIKLEHLLRVPGIIEVKRVEPAPLTLWPGIQKALKQALVALMRMRAREGNHLKADLKKRLHLLKQAHARIQKQAPNVVESYRKRLMKRLQEAGTPITDADHDRLMRELVIFADKCDISEELTRLNSHFDQFSELLETSTPVGRTLDFLCQEMMREINTIGSKASDTLISQQVVTMKSELEKIREQVQNIE